MYDQRLDLPGGDVVFYPGFYTESFSSVLFNTLRANVDWKQYYLNFGRGPVAEPHYVAWYSAFSYTYSKHCLPPCPMDGFLHNLALDMSSVTDTPFNGVLLNYYPDGQSSIGMHSDDEPEFGYNPTIVSLSLGATRRFDFERKDKSLPKVSLDLTHGSVLVMAGETQTNWKHGISKTKQPVGPRINLTFRNIVNPQ